MFPSEQSPVNPRTGLRWAHGDELRCICGLPVRVGIGGYGNLRAHQRGARHAATLRQRIEEAVYANRDEYAAQGLLDDGAGPLERDGAASGSAIKLRTPTKPRQDHPAPISHSPSRTPGLIRLLRRLIHGLSIPEDAPEDHPLSILSRDSASAAELPPDQLWPQSEILSVVHQLFGPHVPDSTIETYVRRGINGLDGLARWLRVHVYKRVGELQLDAMYRLVNAIRTVAARNGYKLPVLEDEPLPSRAPGPPLAGPSQLPEPLRLSPVEEPTDNMCPLCGPRFGSLKNPTEHYNHFGAHILLDARVPLDACGFCLRPPSAGCRFYLRKDKTQLDYSRCSCPRMPPHLSYGPASRSIASSPCSNVPKICPLCPRDAPAVWKYHLQRHILTKHSTADLSQFEVLWRVEEFEIEGLKRILHKAFIRTRRDMRLVEEQDHVLNPAKFLARPQNGQQAGDMRPATPGPSRPNANARPSLGGASAESSSVNGVIKLESSPAGSLELTPAPGPPIIRLKPESSGPPPPSKTSVKKKRPSDGQLPALYTRTIKPPQPILLPQHPAIPIVPSQGQLPMPEIDRAYARQKRLREQGSDAPTEVDAQTESGRETPKRPRMAP